MKRFALIACCLLLCLWAGTANAVNSVVIESKAASAGTPCTVGVYIENDIPITGMVLSFETRTIVGDGYYDSLQTNASLWNFFTGGRMQLSPLGPADPDGAWPGANISRSVHRDPSSVNTCSGPISNTYAGGNIRAGRVSPDGFLFASVSTGNPDAGDLITLDPGADPAGTPSMRFIFNAPLGNGCFMIDTACIAPANHLTYVNDSSQAVSVQFTPGFITVGSGTCVEVPNVPPDANCQNIQVLADGNCQGAAAPADVDSLSTDSDGTIANRELHPGGPYALGGNPVWLVVTDDDGAKDSCEATITVVDETDPVITCPSNSSVQCPDDVPPAFDSAGFLAAGGTLSDNCPNYTFAMIDADTVGDECGGSLARTYQITDASGNTATCVHTIILDDTTPPVVTCSSDVKVLVPNGTDSTIVNYGPATATDNCAGPLPAFCDPPSGSYFQTGTTDTVTCIATDECGNADTCKFTVTVNEAAPENQPPNAICQNVKLDADADCSVDASIDDGSFDPDGDSITLTQEPPGPYTVGTTSVLLTVTDQGGLTDTCTAEVTVNDNTDPVVTCPDNDTVKTDPGQCTADYAYIVTATDNCGDPTVVGTPPSGSDFPIGTTTVEVIATDSSGNADTCYFDVTVIDNEGPSITCPPDIVVQCPGDVPPPYPSDTEFLIAGGSYGDNCVFYWSYEGEVDDGLTCPKTLTRTYAVRDISGNTAECTQTVTIDDTIPPSVTCPNDIKVVVSQGTTDTVITFNPASATDNCDASLDYSYSKPSGSSFPVGVTIDTVIVTDDCGNKDTCQFTIDVNVEVTEPTPPVALCTDVKVPANEHCVADANINNGSYDPDGGLPVTTAQNPPGPYGLGPTLVLLTVTDDEGDTDTCSAWVTVNDVTPPVAVCPGDIKVANDPGQCGAVVDWSNSLSPNDNCGPVDGVFNPASGSFFVVGTTQVEHIVTDDAGNADTCYFDVTVNDTEKPIAYCSDAKFANDSGLCGRKLTEADILPYVDASDNCAVNYLVVGVWIFSKTQPPQKLEQSFFLPVGSWDAYLVAYDDAGNESDSCYFTITINDTEPPTIDCPNDMKVFAPFGQNSAVVNYPPPTTSDNCSIDSTICKPPSGSSFPIGQTAVACTTWDASGNSAACSFTVTVNEGSLTIPGPHTDVDTLIFKVTCGCDTQSVDLYCVQPTIGDTSSCLYIAVTTVPGISVSPNPGLAPRTVDVIGCRGDLAPGTYQGWVYFSGIGGPSSDSIYVILEVNADTPGVVVIPDTLEFTYTGDLFNDKLCLPATISSTGCEETCWELVGGSGDWVWVDPTSGETPDEFEICVDPCSLQAGVYYRTLYFCPCEKGDPLFGCDSLVVKLNVVDPPVLVVEPIELHFAIDCEKKALPLPVEITNGGGGVLDWNAWTNANWLVIEPSDGTAPDTFYVSIIPDSIECPVDCDTLIDSICVYGNKGCALNSPQWVTVELVICPKDTVECDSICGWVSDANCQAKTNCHINDATVELWTSYPDGTLLSSTTTVDGHFCFDVEPNTDYDIRVWKKGYCTQVVGPWSCEDGEIFIDLVPIDFVPLPNWPYFTDYYSSDATSEGYPIQPGDVIHATDPQGVICGITYVELDSAGTYLIHVLGDDPKTTADEGAEFGDSITLWLNCECPLVAPDTWVNFGSFRFDAAWDCRPTGLCCGLCEGWNMWSYNILLPNYEREAVLTTIDLNYDAVRSGLCDYGPISWFANRPVNDLEDVTPWYGYDIHMLEDDTVCVEGEVIDPSTPIYLCAGWNYIPYWPMEIDSREHALASLAGNYSHIFTMYCDYGVASWNAQRDPANNDLVCMETCHGYWIKMNDDDTLIYPSSGYGCIVGAAKMVANSTSGRVTATPMVADYYAGSSNLNAGDAISVRISSGAVIGEGTVGANGAFLIHVYGDVPQTPQVEGAVHGEELVFEVNGLAASAGSNVLWYDRDNQAITLTVDEAGAVPNEYALLQNYPNPFNAGTVMPFVLKNASEWTVTVYNIMGQSVQSFTGFDSPGTVRVNWNGNDHNGSTVPSGVYFYRVTTPEWSATKKMTLLK